MQSIYIYHIYVADVKVVHGIVCDGFHGGKGIATESNIAILSLDFL